MDLLGNMLGTLLAGKAGMGNLRWGDSPGGGLLGKPGGGLKLAGGVKGLLTASSCCPFIAGTSTPDVPGCGVAILVSGFLAALTNLQVSPGLGTGLLNLETGGAEALLGGGSLLTVGVGPLIPLGAGADILSGAAPATLIPLGAWGDNLTGAAVGTNLGAGPLIPLGAWGDILTGAPLIPLGA